MILLALVAFMAGCANAALTCYADGVLYDHSKCWAPDINRTVNGSLDGCKYSSNRVSEVHV